MRTVYKAGLKESQSKAIAYAASYPSSEERQQYTLRVVAAVLAVALTYFAFSVVGQSF